jgi:hypothetical protein
MAINTSWTVKIGGVQTPTDFTSRVMGMQIDQQVDVNVTGYGQCIITLLNKDGALTPGGGGTYGTTDWFAQGVFVACLTNTGGADQTHQVFHGFVAAFDLVDDGVYSTVTITAKSVLALAGRSTNYPYSSGTVDYDVALLGSLENQFLLRMGQPDWGFILNYEYAGATNTDLVTYPSSGQTTVANTIQTNLVPAMNDVFWATTITYVNYPLPLGPLCVYSYTSLGQDNVRNTTNRTDFEFDAVGSLSGSKLPFDDTDFQQAFNNDDLITTATIKGNFAGATQTTTNASTIDTYGNRTVVYNDTFITNQTETNRMATKLVNRYGNIRFNPVSLSLSSSLVKRLASDAAVSKWRHLLDVEKGFWQRAKITWTGSGAASQTAYCVIKGRRISVTPADTVVTLSLGNWADNHAFILDTDQLNLDRLG